MGLPGFVLSILIIGLTTVIVVIATIPGTDEPHPLLAVTEISPLDALAVALIEFVVDVPVQPPGIVHV